MKQHLLKFAMRFNMLDNSPLKPEYSIEDYYDQHFVLHEVGHGRNIIEVNIKDIIEIPHVIERISPIDACFMGLVFGETYAECADNNISISLPHTRLSSTGAQLSLMSYDIHSAMIHYLNKPLQKPEHHYLLNLTRTNHLISRFSPSHSYQMGFYAGELLYQTKQTLYRCKQVNQINRVTFSHQLENEKS